MVVTKRDGRKVQFDSTRIERAIVKAFVSVDGTLTEQATHISKNIANEIAYKECDMTVDEIQDYVEKKLMSTSRKDVAKAYVIYRENRNIERNKNSKLIKRISNRIHAKSIENSNANVDEKSFSGREKEASSDVQKYLAVELGGLSKDVAKAHNEMLVYQHDLEKAILGEHNCLFVDLSYLFKHGFTTRNGDVRPPSTFSTACQLVAVIFQCQSQVQFGGVASVHLDYDLAPFVKMSFKKHLKHYYTDVENMSEEQADKICEWFDVNADNIEHKEVKKLKAYDFAMKQLEREGRQACEGLFHNLNTLESRAGSQVPFSSINFGRDTSPEGRLVTKWLLEASLNGIGRFHRTSIFPISIFSYKHGVNANPEDVNYDMKQLALKSMSKRIYPNWCNGDWSQAHEDENDIDSIFASMGCRSMIGYDRHGFGYNRVGRGNCVPNTIILPKLGIQYGICNGKRDTADIEGFWKAFEKSLSLAEKGLLERFEIMVTQSVKAAPFMYENKTIRGLDDKKPQIYDALKHCTLAIGYIGIAEMCEALFGKNHVHDEKVRNFALSVVQRINEYAAEASARNNLNFSCYATPAEGLCRTSLISLREQYGIIPNVTDREYITNSHHVPVWENVSVFDKIRIEAPFCKYPTGGCITYVELDSSFVHNIKAVEKIIDFAFSPEIDIPYLAINFPIDCCLKCGYENEIDYTCPECGNDEILRLRRVTGYLTGDVVQMNEGKQAEVHDRAKHTVTD